MDLVAGLRKAGEFGLDTEFIPENRLFPELCLIQVAAPGLEAVVDPLALEDLAPIHELISDPAVTKVVHSGKHDFDIFHHAAGVVPKNVFDTQIAAAVIGHGKRTQVALRALVAGFVGRELSKQQQMSDWKRRPLTPRQVDYAISDVRYLLPLRDRLVIRARRMRRSDWLEEEMVPLTEPGNYGLPPIEEAYRMLDGPGFTPSQRGSLAELCAWREERARSRNLPRGWILKDGAVRDLARRQPKNERDLLAPYRRSPAGRPPKGDPKAAQHARTVLSKHAAVVLEVLAKGAKRQVDFTGAGRFPRGPAPESLALLLETWLKLRAAESGVAPELLATQDELRAIAAAWPEEAEGVRPLRGFRRKLLGEDLLLILSGEAVIQVGAYGNSPEDRPPIQLTRLGRLGRFVLRGSRAGPRSA